jgi:hypothetical protein
MILKDFILRPNTLKNLFNLCALICALTIALPAIGVEKQRIDKQADIPRFSYPIAQSLESVVRDKASFEKVTVKIRADIESVLPRYEIADKASHEKYLGALMFLDFLAGNYDASLAGVQAIRALKEKPADKLLYGLQLRAMVAAAKQTGGINTLAYLNAVSMNIRKELDSLPYGLTVNRVKRYKETAAELHEIIVLNAVKDVMQASVDKTGALSADLGIELITIRYVLEAVLPLKHTLINTYTAYLQRDENKQADIWAARQVTLPATGSYTPVNVAVWDSGVDTKLFPNQLLLDPTGKPALIAFDFQAQATTGELYPISLDMQAKLPEMLLPIRGMSELYSGIESREADEIRSLLASEEWDSPQEYLSFFERMSFIFSYVHGTHAAGITLEGNPWARLLTARITFNHKLQPECPSKALVERGARATQAFVDYFKQNKVRVVNISWESRAKGREESLEKCDIGKTKEERKQLAQEYFEIEKQALSKAFSSAPDILFVTAAGNSDLDATLGEPLPSSIVLPNLLTVGGAEQPRPDARLSSHGPNVKVYANGYRVISYVPGGQQVALSGPSVASPSVANLAAKLLAVKPSLTPTDLITIIRETADKSKEGEGILINPSKAMARVM